MMMAVSGVLNGAVICNVGQIDKANQRALNRLVRDGVLVKWRGYWHPVSGASFGIGPLKTCWALPCVRAGIP